ncbi:MAG: hypothetical protein MUF34_31665 [Polyangiaceae bacterium]|jgi:hypothetical protein|nr:hypothetical protein [Polyangiaceae bacterium]
MTASLLNSVLRRSFLPALLASCFVVVGTGCEDSDSSYGDGPSSRGDGGCSKRNLRRPPQAEPLRCADSAVVMLRAPAARQAGVDLSTLWVRACIDDRCSDYPLPNGVLNGAIDSAGAEEALFTFPLQVTGLSCGPQANLAAISLYDTLTKAPIFTAVSEISLGCSNLACPTPSVMFAVPDEAFSCAPRGALVRLQVSDPIALPDDAVPSAIVCVDGICSSAIFLPLSPSGLEPGLEVDVLVEGVDRSSVKETKHVVELMLSSAKNGEAPRTETFELVLEPAASIACGIERSPDLVLPLQPGMFAAPADPGGGRPPPYNNPVAGG